MVISPDGVLCQPLHSFDALMEFTDLKLFIDGLAFGDGVVLRWPQDDEWYVGRVQSR
jgi:hypothetical protein